MKTLANIPLVGPSAAARPKRAVQTRAQATTPPPLNRRDAILTLIGASAVAAGPAFARDMSAAMKAREARKKALKAAAEEMKETGKGESAFEDSGYSVSEDKTPNIHSRQEEGKRTQVNA